MTDPIRIMIADDHPMFREGVKHFLEEEQGLTIIGEASTSNEVLGLVADLLPDILLLDITMPGESGLEVARKISAAYPVVKIVILTASENQDDLLKGLKTGVSGYILKGISARKLANAIRTVAEGGTFISPEIANTLLFELSRPGPPDPFSELTKREEQILRLVSKGLTNREIGERLFLAEKTVKHYMTNILQKLHVRSRVEAALLAQRKSLGKS